MSRGWKGGSEARNPAAGEEDEQPQVRAPGPVDPGPPPEHKLRHQPQPPSPVAARSARCGGGGSQDPSPLHLHTWTPTSRASCGLCKAEARLWKKEGVNQTRNPKQVFTDPSREPPLLARLFESLDTLTSVPESGQPPRPRFRGRRRFDKSLSGKRLMAEVGSEASERLSEA